MHPLAKRIALLASGFSLVIGLFLLAYNLQLISAGAVSTAVNLWPILLVAAGFMLLVDSTKKRVTAHVAQTATHQYALPPAAGSAELALRLQFSYGLLQAGPTADEPRLVTEVFGPRPAPVIRHAVVGSRSELSISVSQPLFPSRATAGDRWRLLLPTGLPMHLSLQAHEADMRLDLRRLSVETLDLRTEAGSHEILLGRPSKKTAAQVYCSGSSLSVVLPAGAFCLVKLLNPFCRLDYPQGDMEKREDGSLVTPKAAPGAGSVEIEVDGPIRDLVLDIEEADAPRLAGET